jgi:predicted RNA-binding protein YlxR (DUF448 family)
VDPGGKVPGRGVNICPELNCLETAISKRVFEKTGKGVMEISTLNSLRDQFAAEIERRKFRNQDKHVVFRIDKGTAESILGKDLTPPSAKSNE